MKTNVYTEWKTWGWQYLRFEKMIIHEPFTLPSGAVISGGSNTFYGFKILGFKLMIAWVGVFFL